MNAPVIDRRFHDPNPVAGINRQELHDAGIVTVSVIGGPGCGKTTLLDATIAGLMSEMRVGVIACDVASHRDADRMARHTRQAVQVNTGEGGVLDAGHVHDALRWLDLQSLDLLLIEHVGTLTGPAAADLGQDTTAVLFSVAGGDDKADKHPELVRNAGVVLLNKIDLLQSVPFDRNSFWSDVRRLNPGAARIEISALRGEGMSEWLKWLKQRVTKKTREAELSHWFG